MNIPEIKISVKIDKVDELFKISSSKDAHLVFKKVFDADKISWQEEVIILCLNRANQVVGFYKVASGGLNSCIVDPRIIFTVALNCCATSIIIAHNHPSGNIKPSSADIELTKRLVKNGELLEIKLLDHLIITDDSFLSMLDEGLIQF